jgi:hypothetical protein
MFGDKKNGVDLAYKKIINVTNVRGLKVTGKYLFKVRCKWENKGSKVQPSSDVMGE